MRTSRIQLVLALSAALAAGASQALADRLDAAVTLGGSATAAVEAPGDVATIGFLVTQGTGRKLSFQVKRTKGSDLSPDVRLVAPDGTTFDIAGGGGSVKPTATSWKAKLPDVPQTGLWRLEVRGAETTSGGFVATIKGKDASSVSGTEVIGINAVKDITIVAGDAAALNISAKRSGGSRIVPQVIVFDPNGLPLQSQPIVGSDKKGTLSVKALKLPLFGSYTVRFSGANGTGGGMTYSISSVPAKFKGTLPVARPGASFEVEPGLTGQLDATQSEPGAGLTFRWSQVSGPTVTLINPTTAQPTFIAPNAPATLAFQLSVASPAGVLGRPATVGVEVANRPVADAGRSVLANLSASVVLDGTGSVARRTTGALLYSWRQMPGDATPVTLTGADTATPSFTAPGAMNTLHFGLSVDNGNARSFEDVVLVVVRADDVNVPDAGREQYVPRMATVHLSALGTHTAATAILDQGILWTQVSGPAVTLAGADTPFPSFTGPRTTADLVFEMTIAGGAGAAADRVAVHVRPTGTNLPAPAKANGPLNAPSGAVSLSAAATTDPNAGAVLSFRWAQVAGAPLPASPPDAATSTVTLPAGNAAYVYVVQANDGLQYGAPDLAGVRNSAFVGAPLALAGPDRSVNPGILVSLDGRGSTRTDGGTGPLTFQWTQLSGRDWFDVDALVPAFDPTAAFASFTLPADVSSLTPTRTLLFELVVNDGTSTSPPDFVTVTYNNLALNSKPVVTAGASDTNPIPAQLVTLQGSVSDREGDPTTVTWSQTSGPSVILAPNAAALSPTFNAPASGTLVFRIVGNDGIDDGTPATVTVVVNRKPVASVVISPTNGSPGTFVTMDGQSSSDPEGQALTFLWTQVTGTLVPPFNNAPPDNVSTAPAITFNAPTGAVGFRLVVNDGRQNSDPRTAGFSGNPPPAVNPSASPLDSTYGAAYGANVTLSANATGTGTLSYTWRQINTGSDPAVTLSSTSVASPNFTVPMPTATPFGTSPQATFGVIANDGVQPSPEGTVTVKFFSTLNNGTISAGSTVYSIIQNRCVSCHSGTNNSQSPCVVGSGNNASGYGMANKTAFLTNSRGVVSCGSASKRRLPAAGVTGASTTNAYLYDRITSVSPIMPTTGGSLTQTEINQIKDWIDQGVQDN